MNRSIRCFLRRIPWTFPLWFRNQISVASCPAGFQSLHLATGTTGVLDVLLESPPFDLSLPTPTSSAVSGQSGSPRVPRWRLAREDPFLNERSHSALNCFSDDCSFCHTTYRALDYTRPSGEFGVLLHHPRFFRVDWHAGVCQSSGNGPGEVTPFFVVGTGY